MSKWKKRLEEVFSAVEAAGSDAGREPRRRVRQFIREVVVPAFEEVATDLQEYGRDVEVEHSDRRAVIRVLRDGEEEFLYEVRARAYRTRDFAFPVIPLHDDEGVPCRAEARLGDRPLHEDVTDFDRDGIIESFLTEYSRHLRWYL